MCCCSLRAIYGRDEMKNALHGSADQEAALREIRFFFPKRKHENDDPGDEQNGDIR